MKKKNIAIAAGTACLICGGIGLFLMQRQIKEPVTQDGVEAEPEEEEVTLDWYINYSWFSTPWGENMVSKQITEETGVSINFVTPNGNETEKLSALMASDSLPDLITLGWWEPQYSEMIRTGKVYPLNELAEKYTTDWEENTDRDIINWYTEADGNIYGYPNSSISPTMLEEYEGISANEVFMVRKDIYEAIGSPDMTTQEGFYNAVKKAVEMFPEVDGEPLIPIGAHEFTDEGNVSFDLYLQNFLAVPFEEDGEMYDRYTDPEYLSWLKVFRQLGEEGYLADDIFVDQRTQMEEKIADGRYFCMLYQYTDMKDQQMELYGKNPDQCYIAIDGPKNSNGDDYTLPCTGINGWTVTLISKKCKYPDKAIQLMNYLNSEEGQKMVYLGVEGEMYEEIDGEIVINPEVSEMMKTSRSDYDKIYGGDDTYWMLQNNVIQLQWAQDKSEAVSQLEEWTFPYVVYNGQYDQPLPSDSREADEDAKIKLLWSKTLPKLLLADSDETFDQLMETFVAKRKTIGYDEVQRKKWELTLDAKEKLGME